jgi:Tol biopolymer transport system component
MNRFQKGLVVLGMLSVAALGKLAFDYITHVSLIPLAWSPDGRSIVVNIENDLSEHTGSVGLASAKTGRVERVLHENEGFLACYSAAFSPDGSSVAFAHLGCHVVDLATNQYWEPPNDNAPAWFPSRPKSPKQLERKSPDGKWVAGVVTGEDGGDALTCVRTGSTSPKRLVTHLAFYVAEKAPEWSATNELVYWDTDSTPEGIYAITPATGKKRFLTEGYAPIVSPDGTRLAYVQNGDLRFLEIVADITQKELKSKF